jgi:hypothetical protein
LNRLALGVTKTASSPSPSVGDTVVYTYIITNNSNVTLTNLTLNDDKLGSVTLGTTTLPAGQSTTGVASYTVKTTDAGTTIVNVATATGTSPDNTTVTGRATASIAVPAVQGTGQVKRPARALFVGLTDPADRSPAGLPKGWIEETGSRP